MQVQGLIIAGPRMVESQRLSVPDPCESDVIVQVEFCGLCTPEQRVYRGTRATYPYWGGHELSGVIHSLPSKPEVAARIGDRVAVLLMRRCGHCHACRAGLDNHCAYLQPETRPGLPTGPGGLTDRIVVPAYKIFAVPPDLPQHLAAVVEPTACVARGVARAQPRRGEFAAVIGGGTMGLIHALLLSLKGCRVFVFDDDEATYHAARQAGACFAGPLAGLSDPQQRKAWTDGWGFDIICCTRFGAAAIRAALEIAARGARILLYQSNPNEDTVTLDPNLLHYREIQLIGTVAQSKLDVAEAVRLLTGNAGRFDALNIEIILASRAREAFERAIDPRVNRVLIDLRSSIPN